MSTYSLLRAALRFQIDDTLADLRADGWAIFNSHRALRAWQRKHERSGNGPQRECASIPGIRNSLAEVMRDDCFDGFELQPSGSDFPAGYDLT